MTIPVFWYHSSTFNHTMPHADSLLPQVTAYVHQDLQTGAWPDWGFIKEFMSGFKGQMKALPDNDIPHYDLAVFVSPGESAGCYCCSSCCDECLMVLVIDS